MEALAAPLALARRACNSLFISPPDCHCTPEPSYLRYIDKFCVQGETKQCSCCYCHCRCRCRPSCTLPSAPFQDPCPPPISTWGKLGGSRSKKLACEGANHLSYRVAPCCVALCEPVCVCAISQCEHHSSTSFGPDSMQVARGEQETLLVRRPRPRLALCSRA